MQQTQEFLLKDSIWLDSHGSLVLESTITINRNLMTLLSHNRNHLMLANKSFRALRHRTESLAAEGNTCNNVICAKARKRLCRMLALAYAPTRGRSIASVVFGIR